jgi:TRAP-type C4-dicarboxylate transport system substrate-binding protein
MEKRKIVVIIAGISLALVLLALPLMAACAEETTPTTPTGPGVPTVPTVPVTPTTPTDGEAVYTAENPLIWKTSWYGVSRDYTKGNEWFYERLKEATGGRWVNEIYYGAILCPIKREAFCVRDGIVDVSSSTGAEVPVSFFPPYTNYFVPPRADANQAKWMIEGSQHPMVMAELAQYNLRTFIHIACGARVMFATSPIYTVDDLDGLVLFDEMPQGRMWEAFGASVAYLTWADTYENVQRGILDGAYSEFLISISDPWRWHEVFEYVGDQKLRSPCGFASRVCNIDKWNELPEEFKEIYWDVLNNEYPAKVTEIQNQLEIRWLPRFEEWGKCTVCHQEKETWLYPLLDEIKTNQWPGLIADLNAMGHDGKAWFKYCAEMAAKYGLEYPSYLGTLEEFLASV